MEINKIYNLDAIEYLKTLPNNSVDLIFTDPPYALGSDVIILPNGKPEYRKAVDFMAKWNQPNGDFWEEWFKEANRVLKYGGHCLMFGLDRQLLLYKYFACFAGFTEKQSLYWFSISGFPKSSDLSKNLDKNAGAERHGGVIFVPVLNRVYSKAFLCYLNFIELWEILKKECKLLKKKISVFGNCTMEKHHFIVS